MKAKEQLNSRHLEAVEKLKTVALPKMEKHGSKKCCELIGAELGISYPTVENYVYGRAKDGFLTEAITQQFKALKIAN